MSESKSTVCPKPGFLTTAFAFLVALSASLVLQFAAVAKILGPNPKLFLIQPGQHGFEHGVLLDYAVAVGELVVVLLLMAWHRCRLIWPLVALMFAGFAGYALYWTMRGEKCGCFGKLWEPPLGVSLGIDLAMVFLSLLIAGAMRVPKALVALVLAVCVGAGFAGYKGAERLAPPKRTEVPGMTGQDRLLASELLKDAREQAASGAGPRWYVFIYDPGCHVCEQMKPMIEMFEQQYGEGDPNIRIRKLSVIEIQEKTGIDTFEWNPTPTALLIKDGAVEKVWRGTEVPLPDPEFVMKAMSGALP